ncbi:MAG: glycosyltransferase [Acidobacteria bacterium]|nr:glycosyltransferase [Acidobacteriota bacterium]
MFSVVIPTYNRAHLLPQALESVFTQSFKDYEIIVVDDGSTDGTLDYIRSLNGDLKVLTQPNRGPGAARNVGISVAKGDYVAFLDSDDLWFPWTLATFQKALSSRSWPIHVMGTAVTFSGLPLDQYGTAPSVERFEGFSDFLSSVPGSVIWSSGNAVVRRSAFSNDTLFDLDMCCFEDQDLGLRLGCAPGFVRILSPPTLLCRLTSRSLTRAGTEWSVSGLKRLIQRERSGGYPGGAARRQARCAYICLSIRSLSMALARGGRCREAWKLYVEGLRWNVSLGRFRYLIGFPVLLSGFLMKHAFSKRLDTGIAQDGLA